MLICWYREWPLWPLKPASVVSIDHKHSSSHVWPHAVAQSLSGGDGRLLSCLRLLISYYTHSHTHTNAQPWRDLTADTDSLRNHWKETLFYVNRMLLNGFQNLLFLCWNPQFSSKKKKKWNQKTQQKRTSAEKYHLPVQTAFICTLLIHLDLGLDWVCPSFRGRIRGGCTSSSIRRGTFCYTFGLGTLKERSNMFDRPSSD